MRLQTKTKNPQQTKNKQNYQKPEFPEMVELVHQELRQPQQKLPVEGLITYILAIYGFGKPKLIYGENDRQPSTGKIILTR
ncbi:hypothetical protein [Candidatus Absconditicoccus praedator]|uniref:hypothetical protein n=1 Tax=Candidatus Absconditicoccus praedator TaxID=2735562 RepID=UPI001E2F7CB6|nr:hypothetical protein [Candidatus Absconditicoccus praedator]UFX82885.1 hypothetical protein HLG78_02000 [Candidatus Absconditicoccus praedator]